VQRVSSALRPLLWFGGILWIGFLALLSLLETDNGDEFVRIDIPLGLPGVTLTQVRKIPETEQSGTEAFELSICSSPALVVELDVGDYIHAIRVQRIGYNDELRTVRDDQLVEDILAVLPDGSDIRIATLIKDTILTGRPPASLNAA